MKVIDLANALKAIPNDVEVYLASDEEGNAFGEIESWSSADTKKGNVAFILYPGRQFQFEEVFKLD
jgi:hypothetical protein